MKALTLHQPWASFVALGMKTIETRSWSTSYRGPLAIHAGVHRPELEMLEDGLAGELYDGDGECLAQWSAYEKRDYEPPAPPPNDRWWISLAPNFGVEAMPLGCVVATCVLVDVIATYPHMAVEWPTQMPYGDFTPGRFAWLLRDVQPLERPIKATGHQGLWNWDTESLVHPLALVLDSRAKAVAS